MNLADVTGAAALRRSILLVWVVMLVILAYAAHAALVLDDASVHLENGLLENSQAALLLLSALVALHAATTTGCRVDRCVLLLFAWTCFGMVLRELDLEKFEAIPVWLGRLVSGRGRTLTLVSGYLALGTSALWQFWRHRRAVFGLLQRRTVVLLLAVGLVLQIGRYFEKHTALLHHELLEESAELLAYALILVVALRFWRHTRQRAAQGLTSED